MYAAFFAVAGVFVDNDGLHNMRTIKRGPK
jgi:hypothetical protein